MAVRRATGALAQRGDVGRQAEYRPPSPLRGGGLSTGVQHSPTIAVVPNRYKDRWWYGRECRQRMMKVGEAGAGVDSEGMNTMVMF